MNDEGKGGGQSTERWCIAYETAICRKNKWPKGISVKEKKQTCGVRPYLSLKVAH